VVVAKLDRLSRDVAFVAGLALAAKNGAALGNPAISPKPAAVGRAKQATEAGRFAANVPVRWTGQGSTPGHDVAFPEVWSRRVCRGGEDPRRGATPV